MGMHTLPLLDKDHALFDWEDHPNSYNALKPGTPTKEFHRTAWNWIVFVLYSALITSGLGWDEKYADYSGTLIKDPETKLTARKFNSVSWNVDRLFPIVWGWASDPEHRGYVGRLEFHGRSEYGKECDKVYPEYILELVEKINFLIELMRGTWPTSQSGGTSLAPVKIKAAGASNKALVSPTHHLADVPLYGGGIAAKGVTMNGQMLTGVEIQTGAQALLCLPSGADSRSYSSHNISGNILPAVMAEAGCQVFSMETADADKHRSIIGAAQELSASKSQAEVMSNLLAFVDAFYRVPLWELADVEGCPAGIINATHPARMLEQARPQVNPALAGAAYYRAIGKQEANTEDLPGAFMGAVLPGKSRRMADAEKVYNSTSGAQFASRMLTDAELDGSHAKYALSQHGAALISRVDAGENAAAAVAVSTVFGSRSEVEAKQNPISDISGKAAAESTGWAMPEIRPNLEMAGLYLADIMMEMVPDANPVRDVSSYAAALSDAAAAPESLPPLAVKAKKAASTNTQAGAEADQILMAEAQHTGQTVPNSSAEAILALFAGALKVSAVRDWTGLEKIENLQVTAQMRSGIRKLAEPVSNTSAQVATKHRSGSSVRCALDFMIPESAWYDPVQRDSDLYIRSVYSTWTDGSKLNIDTAFFLEPVQEGSNLHIRMDIFGGE